MTNLLVGAALSGHPKLQTRYEWYVSKRSPAEIFAVADALYPTQSPTSAAYTDWFHERLAAFPEPFDNIAQREFSFVMLLYKARGEVLYPMPLPAWNPDVRIRLKVSPQSGAGALVSHSEEDPNELTVYIGSDLITATFHAAIEDQTVCFDDSCEKIQEWLGGDNRFDPVNPTKFRAKKLAYFFDSRRFFFEVLTDDKPCRAADMIVEQRNRYFMLARDRFIGTLRYIIAHELAHILLGHVARKSDDECSPNRVREEMQADAVAIGTLAMSTIALGNYPSSSWDAGWPFGPGLADLVGASARDYDSLSGFGTFLKIVYFGAGFSSYETSECNYPPIQQRQVAAKYLHRLNFSFWQGRPLPQIEKERHMVELIWNGSDEGPHWADYAAY